ncbi:MAG TPA: DsbC family protein [Burkholderiales bacterium]
MIIRSFAAVTLALAALSASADEASIRRAIEARFNGVAVESVTKTPYSGLYEVVIGDEIVYTDDKVTYIFTGNIIDANTRRNLTEERQSQLLAVNFKDLPLDNAIKTVRGSGKRVMVIFADPRCGFCKQFEQNLYKLTDVTIYTMLYPVIAPDSAEISRNIWCSKNPSQAWLDTMLKGVLPPTNTCATPLDKNLALGKRLRVSGTPTTFLPNGQRIVGARFPELVQALDQASK